MSVECRGFEYHPRQLRKVTTLGVLCCALLCLFDLVTALGVLCCSALFV